LQLGDSDLSAGLNGRGVRREQGQKQANAVPYFHIQHLTDANQLTGCGVGVDDDEIDAFPRMPRDHAGPFISDVLKATASKVGSRVAHSGLIDGFND
jgi:hypothetical protein